MLRGFFLSLSNASWAQRLITRWSVAWKAASRFVAGETTADALRVAKQLNDAGLRVTLDHLGEHTATLEDARQAKEDILVMLREIEQAGVNAGMSIKLSQLGLSLSEDQCKASLLEILQVARDCHNFIRIDMEESALTEQTLALYYWARAQGLDNLGLVIQSYLYRSESDLRRLLEVDGRVRLVKGAYREPPEVAFPKKADVDSNYDRLVTLALTHCQETGPHAGSPDGRFPPLPAIATHDIARIRFAQGLAHQLGLSQDQMEFQMLYGIRRDLQQQLLKEGYPVRIYVPYGSHWYPYLMRRLGERPANLWFVLSNFFKQ